MQSSSLAFLTAAIVAISFPVYAQGSAGGGSGAGSTSGSGPSGNGVGSSGPGTGRAGGAAANSGNIGAGNVNSVTAAPSSSTSSPSYGQSPSGAAATRSLSSTNTGVMINPNAAPPSSGNSGASVAPAGRIGDKMPSRDAQ